MSVCFFSLPLILCFPHFISPLSSLDYLVIVSSHNIRSNHLDLFSLDFPVMMATINEPRTFDVRSTGKRTNRRTCITICVADAHNGVRRHLRWLGKIRGGNTILICFKSSLVRCFFF